MTSILCPFRSTHQVLALFLRLATFQSVVIIICQEFFQYLHENHNVVLLNGNGWLDSQHVVESDTHDDVLVLESFDYLTGVDILVKVHSQIQPSACDFGDSWRQFFQLLFEQCAHYSTVFHQAVLLQLREHRVRHKTGG